MTARSNIGDVAERAGVSVATVSRALRGLPNVSPTTRRRVEQAAAALEYTVDARASSLASGRTNTIGLVAPWFDSWYESAVISGIETVLEPAGYDLLVYAIKRSIKTLPILKERVRGGTVDGIIFIDVFFEENEVAGLADFGLPMVLIGSQLTLGHSLTIDNIAGARLATQHLLDLGHQNLLFLGGAQRSELVSPVSSLREQGAREAVRAVGLAESALESCYDGDFSTGGGQRVMAMLDERDASLPTAVVCASDEMAIGLMTEAVRRGYSVPGDISVVGFDDHDMSELFGLTTIRQGVRDSGRLAGQLILDTLDGDREGDFEHIDLGLELILRSSTAAPRKS